MFNFIYFDIPVMHIASTFNFYNRSSIRTDLRIFGPNKPIIKIDSFKTEKKNIQCITNAINISIELCNEQIEFAENFVQTNYTNFNEK